MLGGRTDHSICINMLSHVNSVVCLYMAKEKPHKWMDVSAQPNNTENTYLLANMAFFL